MWAGDSVHCSGVLLVECLRVGLQIEGCRGGLRVSIMSDGVSLQKACVCGAWDRVV